MTHFEKIEKIRNAKHLSITEFLEKTNIPKTSYYELKNGKKEFLTHRFAKRIVFTFRDYSYDWLMNDDTKFISNLNSEDFKIFDEKDNSIENIKLKIENIKQELFRINLLKEFLENTLELKIKFNELENNNSENFKILH